VRKAVIALVLLLAACNEQKRGASFDLPERDEHVISLEQRLGTLIEKSQRGTNSPGQCTVRVLGEQKDTVWVWANCRWLPAGAVGGPFRIDVKTVTPTKDGSEYDDSVRKLFPYEMAEAILHDAERLQPVEDPIG
jgi:hypothetical protein